MPPGPYAPPSKHAVTICLVCMITMIIVIAGADGVLNQNFPKRTDVVRSLSGADTSDMLLNTRRALWQ